MKPNKSLKMKFPISINLLLIHLANNYHVNKDSEKKVLMRVLLIWKSTILDKIYWNTTEISKFCNFNPGPPNLNVEIKQSLEKKSFKTNTEFRGRGRECGRRNLWNFCVFSIYFVRDCLKIWECRIRRFFMFLFLHFIFKKIVV